MIKKYSRVYDPTTVGNKEFGSLDQITLRTIKPVMAEKSTYSSIQMSQSFARGGDSEEL